MVRRRTRRAWYLVLVVAVALVFSIGLIAGQPRAPALSLLVRGAALLGYQAIFLAILSSAYIREISRIFGYPFVKVHHILSVMGIVLITLHPLGVAINLASLGVFLPRFDSIVVFLELGGRLAWYLIAVAALAAVLRKTLGPNWRMVHFLNYAAFLLGTIHAIMIGTDFQRIVVKLVAATLALLILFIFIQKRLQKRRR